MKRPPKPRKPWRQCSIATASRFKTRRARFRAESNPKAYKKFARWVRKIRRQFDKSQEEFARMVGVSIRTIIRWEGAVGWMPSINKNKTVNGKLLPSNIERLTKLGELAEDLRRTGTKFE